MCVSGFSSISITCYFVKIFYLEIAFFKTFFRRFDNILLAIHNKMFRVGKPKGQVHVDFIWEMPYRYWNTYMLKSRNYPCRPRTDFEAP